MVRLKTFSAAIVALMMGTFCAGAVTLSGTVPVSINSDTAASAKNIAFAEARRQILSEQLRQYANEEQLRAVIASASNNDLTDLIATSSIDGEQLSDTAYSANISMTIDIAAARNWLNEKNVQNWLPDGASADKFIVVVNLGNAMADFIELKRIARDENIDFATKYMTPRQMTVELPTSSRGAFTIALHQVGWKYAAQDGVLRIWK